MMRRLPNIEMIKFKIIYFIVNINYIKILWSTIIAFLIYMITIILFKNNVINIIFQLIYMLYLSLIFFKTIYTLKSNLLQIIPPNDIRFFLSHFPYKTHKLLKSFFLVNDKLFFVLSQIIPKDFTVIIFDNGFNSTGYYFEKHKKCIVIDIGNDSNLMFKPKNCLIYSGSGEEFIRTDFIKFNIDPNQCFIIYCNKQNNDRLNRLIRMHFTHVYINTNN